MSGSLQRLSFVVSLLDNVTGPVGKIQKALNNTAESAKSAFADIGAGAMGVMGAGLAMKNLLDPAIQMDRALGEVRSLGVAESALKDLSDTALDFSVKYGKSAAEFVSASYDIQSAIAGLSGAELSQFTESAGVLAAATKSNTATITNYMGTMYGVFKNTADAMGKSNWVKVLSGQTASAVQMFKTTGDQMSAAFTSIGANATSAGISMGEQMAILGTLQSTMSGSEAGTKYKAFLSGVGNAQKALGLQFTDSQGNMLGMVDILEQLKGKFGDTFDVAESDTLKKAFGSDEAVGLIKQLMADTGGLAKNINDLGKVNGMQKAEEMAAAMVDPWQRLGEGITAVKIGFGQALLPVINPVVDRLADGASVLTRWTKEFPTVTRWIGYGVVTILSMTAALGVLAIASGIAKVAMLGYAAATKLANLAMRASPIGLVITGITALIAGVAYLINNWDSLKTSLNETGWGKAVVFMLESIGGLLSKLGTLAMTVFDVLGTAVSPFLWVLEKVGWVLGNVIGGAFIVLKYVALTVFSAIAAAIGGVAKVLEGVVWGINKFFEGINYVQDAVIGLMNKIPGVDIGVESKSPEVGTVNRELKTASVAPGGVTNHISKTMSNSSNRNNNVTINTTQAPTQHLMDSWMTMEAF